MPPEFLDYWPSLTSTHCSEAMSGDKFMFQVGQMHDFLTLVLKIAFSHLYRDPEVAEAGQMYDSFFPRKQDPALSFLNPMDQSCLDFRYKILSYVNNYVLCPESLPVQKTEESGE
jgi:hypothetical protein